MVACVPDKLALSTIVFIIDEPDIDEGLADVIALTVADRLRIVEHGTQDAPLAGSILEIVVKSSSEGVEDPLR